MWVSIPTVVLVAFLAARDVAVAQDAAPVSTSVLPSENRDRNQDEPPAISLEYKPLKPFYASSGSNVAQIVPPGAAWPANAEGYANFSQLGTTKLEVNDDVPLLQAAAPTGPNMINLDMSNPDTNFADALVKVLAPELSNVQVKDQPQTIQASINITPPPNADMTFIAALQTAVRKAVGKLAPFAGTSLKIAITKSGNGAIINVKAYLNVIVPSRITPTLPPSTVPEIDLTKTSTGLIQNLQTILSKELLVSGYNADSKSIQNFSLSFSILPPNGATKDYVRLYILGPLQTALKNIAPRAGITSVSVNTQESNQKILRQTVTLNVQVIPPPEFQINENVVEIPEVHLNQPGNVVSSVVTTLQNEIIKSAAINPGQPKTLSIPFKISPPAGATQQQIQDMYVTPLAEMLSKLDPTGKMLKISEKTLPNGDLIIIVYMNVPANAGVVSTSTTPTAETGSSEAISINSRSAFPEGEEDEIPPEEETSETSETLDNIPTNAITTPPVDLTKGTATLDTIQQILNDELSPLTNPSNDGQSKTLAIPFIMKPSAGTTVQGIEKNVVGPLGKVLNTLEPTGNVVTTQTKSLPDGQVEAIVYFNIPSVDNSKTYQDLSQKLQQTTSSTAQPTTEQNVGTSSVAPITTESAVSSKVTKNEVSTESVSSTTATTEVVTTENPPTESGLQIPLVSVELSNPSVMMSKIDDAIDKISKGSNGQPQEVAIGIVMPEKPSLIMELALKNCLQVFLPGEVSPKPQYKNLPDGNVEAIYNYKIPTTTKQLPNKIQVTTESVTSTTPKTSETTVKPQDEIQSEDELSIPVVVVKPTDPSNIKEAIVEALDKVKKVTNDQPQEVGIAFVMPEKPSYFVELALRKSLELFVPGEFSREPKYKNLPDGKVELIFNYKPPSTTEQPIKKNEVSTESVQSTTSVSSLEEVIVSSEKPQGEIQPENELSIPTIVLKSSDPAEIMNQIDQGIEEIKKAKNGQPQEVGLAFVMGTKPSFFTELTLQKTLQILLPGDVSEKPQYKNLPDGSVEVIFNYKPPSTTELPIDKNEVSRESVTSTTSVPKTTEIIVSSEKPENEIQPEIETSIPTIVLKSSDPAKIRNQIDQGIEEIRKSKNGQPQEVGLSFVMGTKPSLITQIALQKTLQILLPGDVSEKPQYKNLPDGSIEVIFNYKPPSTTGLPIDKNEVSTESATSTTTVPKTTEVIVSSEEQENEIQPEIESSIPTIVLKSLDPAEIMNQIDQGIEEIKKARNGQPQEVGLAFVMSTKPSFFTELTLQKTLQMLLPGDVSEKPQYKNLPDGNVETIFNYKLPAPIDHKDGKVIETVGKQTEPSITKKESRTLLTTPKPEIETPVTEVPRTEYENAVILPPINIESLDDIDTVENGVERRIKEASENKNGVPEIIGLPFDLPDSYSNFLETSLLKVLETILPGEVLPNPETRVLPNGQKQLIVYYKTPNTNNIPSEAVEDVNLDEPESTIAGGVGKALVNAISSISSNPENLNKPANIKLNIYTPSNNGLSQNKGLVEAVLSQLKTLEPTAEIVSSNVNQNPGRTDPDGVIEITIPSLASSQTLQNLKNTIKIPTINGIATGVDLLKNIKDLLQQSLKSAGELNPEGSQIFKMNFKLDPFETKASISKILKSLNEADPTGQIVSYRIKSGPDGFDYLEIIYLVPKLKNSIIYEAVRPQRPEVVYESVTDIDARNPLNGLLEKVINEVGAAEDEFKGTRKEQLVDLPLDFKFTDSQGLSDSRVSEIISETLPYIKGYINQILPDGRVLSVDTVELPDSDDVILKIVVRTPYEPDNTIVIEEERPRRVVTTPKPKSRGLFGMFGL